MAGNMQDNFDENGNPIRCSFCGKEQGQVRRLVKGPTNIFICDECVAACSEILEESLASDFMDAARNGNLFAGQIKIQTCRLIVTLGMGLVCTA